MVSEGPATRRNSVNVAVTAREQRSVPIVHPNRTASPPASSLSLGRLPPQPPSAFSLKGAEGCSMIVLGIAELQLGQGQNRNPNTQVQGGQVASLNSTPIMSKFNPLPVTVWPAKDLRGRMTAAMQISGVSTLKATPEQSNGDTCPVQLQSNRLPSATNPSTQSSSKVGTIDSLPLATAVSPPLQPYWCQDVFATSPLKGRERRTVCKEQPNIPAAPGSAARGQSDSSSIDDDGFLQEFPQALDHDAFPCADNGVPSPIRCIDSLLTCMEQADSEDWCNAVTNANSTANLHPNGFAVPPTRGGEKLPVVLHKARCIADVQADGQAGISCVQNSAPAQRVVAPPTLPSSPHQQCGKQLRVDHDTVPLIYNDTLPLISMDGQSLVTEPGNMSTSVLPKNTWTSIAILSSRKVKKDLQMAHHTAVSAFVCVLKNPTQTLDIIRCGIP